ncbi:uncharacterized protein LOC120621696 [Pteropus medius]|uniref:uncharacterized protein LOC120621696 n=1 Tax=Pteropus vampyrus TaxID=132908 RepID=UPI00196ABCC8|nr:uncharacterized protein LOC120621696 [Pteropus giganteus]
MEAGQVPRALPKALKSKIIAIEARRAETQLGNTPCPNLGRGASRPAAPRLLGWWPRLGSATPDGGRRQGAQLCEPGQGLARRGGRAAEAVSLPAEPSSAPPTERIEPTSRSRCRQRRSALVQSTTPAVRTPIVCPPRSAPEPADPKWSLNRWPVSMRWRGRVISKGVFAPLEGPDFQPQSNSGPARRRGGAPTAKIPYIFNYSDY